MFLDQGKLKKLMKKAYDKNQLHVSQRKSEYLITNNQWALVVDITAIPSKTLGSMIELIREFPGNNRAICAGKGSVQYEMNDMFDEYWELMHDLLEEQKEVVINPIPLLSNGIQLLKGEELIGIRQEAAEAVRPEEIIKEIETECRGPYFNRSMVYWKNNRGIFGIAKKQEDWKSKIQEMLEL